MGQVNFVPTKGEIMLSLNLFKLSSLLLGFILTGLLTTSVTANDAMIPLAVSDSIQIFYRPTSGSSCQGPISLGDFLKKTLAGEVYDNWPVEALRANAIAARSFTISPYKSTVHFSNGQYYYCTNAWEQYGFGANKDVSQYPNVVVAVDYTNGILMTHPDASAREVSQGWPSSMRFGAIEASYQSETGGWTLGISNRPWLKSIYDPISSGSPGPGMGQYGSKRWGQGSNDSGQAYPKWDYRRILAHYYTGIEFVGITNPDPPEGFRANMLKIEGISAAGLTMCRSEERTGIRVLYQNTGQWAWPVDGTDFQGLCAGPVPDYKTLLGHHVYRQDGNPACPSCPNGGIGLRRTPMCRINAIQPGEHFWVNGFKIWVPDDPAFGSGNTYLLRFDVEHRHASVWDGYPNFNWPAQDIPVTICGGSGGGGSSGPPNVRIRDYPPAVVSLGDLNNNYFRFSWQGINNPDAYDLQHRSKDVWESSYPATFQAPALWQNMNKTQTRIDIPVDCGRDHKDWQFRLQAHKAGKPSSNWVQVEAQTRVWPHPWPSYWSIVGLVLDSDPGSWHRPLNVVNLGGGSFNWSASANQSWITLTSSSGVGEGPLGVVINKPGGIGDYIGSIALTMTNPTPTRFCNTNQPSVVTFNIPVTVLVRETFEYQFLPLIFKNSP
ncbi:MAG: SpoIID/LytB domain-containing protein [Anaerolineae bacterium]